MLSLESPPGLNCEDFWQLPVTKEFAQPDYYIGQTVFHNMEARGGEILHPVEVHGLCWTGIDWEYAVSLPEDHPEFEEEDHEWTFLAEWQLESM